MNEQVHIIGGGVIGLCSAWYLQQAGYQVTVVEKTALTDGTSFGNAGMIVPSHFVPMTTPGVITQGLMWLLDSKSPFYIKPRLNLDLLQWLWRFVRSANQQQVARAMPVLYEINERSKELYRALAEEANFHFGYAEKGLLMLYQTQKQADKEAQLAEQAQQLGIAAEIYDANGLQQLEPDLELDVLGGLYFPGDAHLYPNQLMRELKVKLKAGGATFQTNFSVLDFTTDGGKITALVGDSGQQIPVQQVVLTAGSWTGQLLRKAGIKIHLQDGKGYSFTLNKPALRPRIPTILTEAKVAITPMGEDLRISGTLELSGLSSKINPQRVQGIIDSVPRYYTNMELPTQSQLNIWQGYRPCTPDGLPYIDQSKQLTNLFVGTGHGMMGLSLGAITGKLLCELVAGKAPSIALDMFRLDRF